MKKNIVKYDNQFNLANISKLSKAEGDIFFGILSTFSTEKVIEATFSFAELKEKIGMMEQRINNERFDNYLKSLQDNLVSIYFQYRNGSAYSVMPLFKLFHSDKKTETMQVKLNEEFATYFFDIPEKIGFTKFELDMFLQLKSKYSQILLRHLLENFHGSWSLPFDEFQNILGFPKSYKPAQCLQAIDRILPQLQNLPIFDSISYSIEKARKVGSPIKSITFKYFINRGRFAEMRGQTTLGDCVIDVETKQEFKGYIEIPSDNPMYDDQLQPLFENVTHEVKCPMCGSRVLRRKNKHGQEYRACENSKYIHIDGSKNDCCFYEPLDEDE